MTTKTTRIMASNSVWMTASTDRLDELGRIVDNGSRRHPWKILRQDASSTARRLQSPSVGAGALIDRHGDGFLAVEVGVGEIILRADLDPRDVSDPGDAALFVALDDDVCELIGRLSGAPTSGR